MLLTDKNLVIPLTNSNVHTLLCSYLSGSENSCSIGGIGALAEFHATSATELQSHDNYFSANSELGCISIKSQSDLEVLAYETLGKHEDTWRWGLVFSIPKESCSLPNYTVLREIGRDCNANNPAHRNDLLFDIGTGIPHVQFCIRTNENELISVLQRHEGTAIATSGNPVLDIVAKASPHRVVQSQTARIEVYQKIDPYKTPMGPHTHLLPKLLRGKRSYASNVPLPLTQAPQLTIYPENPLFDRYGHSRKFNKAAYDSFLPSLIAYSVPEFYAEKIRLRTALSNHVNPEDYPPPNSRLTRTAHEIELRQQTHLSSEKKYINQWRKKKRNHRA